MKDTIKNQLNENKSGSSIKRSIKGNFWIEKNVDVDHLDLLMQKYKLDRIVAKILLAREVDESKVKDYFNPKIKNLLPNPSNILDLDNATNLIVDFISKKKKIGIFGDYDVDGATSTALLGSYFKKINVLFEYYIPDRIKEGYGPNIGAFYELKNKGCGLIITVDCGTTSNDIIEKIIKEGTQIIVVDHHQQGEELPKNCFVVNPNRNDDKSDLKNLAAVGVSFLLMISINRKLKEMNFFDNDSIPNLLDFLDLVALGTICDVVRLDNLNRAFVKQGIKIIDHTKNIGLKSLIRSSKIEKKIDEYHLGYVMGPRINAGGRIGKSSKGVELLLSENSSHSLFIADELTELNIERQKIEKKVEDLALKNINNSEKIICVHASDWHPGVIGIVAGRLTERFSKPSIVISENEIVCKGSARSISGFNIGNLITKAYNKGILLSGGGHKMAGGLSIKKEKISDFKEFINKETFNNIIENKKYFDHEIDLSLIDHSLCEKINNLSPFGSGNPKPKFLIKKSFVKFPKLVGNNHLSCFLSDIYGNTIKAICFKAFDTRVGEFIMNSNGKLIEIIGQININFWNGSENLQVQIEDVYSLN